MLTLSELLEQQRPKEEVSYSAAEAEGGVMSVCKVLQTTLTTDQKQKILETANKQSRRAR